MQRHMPYPNTSATGSWAPRLRIFTSAIGKQWIILPSAFFVAAACGMSAIGLLFYVRDVFGSPPAIVSVFAAVWTATYAASCLALRPISARLLPRHSLMIATGGTALSLLGILAAHSLAAAFLFYGLFGIALSFFWPPIMGWLSVGLEESALSRVIGRYNLAWSTGSIISPLLGGILYEQSRTLPLYVAFFLLAGTALFIIAASRFLPKIKGDIHREQLHSRSLAPLPDSSSPLRVPARFVLFVTYFGFGIVANVLPLQLRDHMGMSEGAAGLMLLIRAAATTITFVVLARTVFWHFKRFWIVMAQVVVLVILALLSRTSTAVVYALSVVILGSVMGFVYNTSVFHGISGSQSRAGRMAMHESTLNSGAVVGSIVGGAIYQATSIGTAFLAAEILSLCSLAVVLVLAYVPLHPARPPVQRA
ncbi:MAG TPA: MFS transporter [Spirochaetia bacterium]|nr:MFS transporter [Spirochaetia bacterium]